MSKFHEQLSGGDGVQPLYEKVWTIKQVIIQTKAEIGEQGRDINLELELSKTGNDGVERNSRIWLNGNFFERKNNPGEGKVNMPLTISRLFRTLETAAQLQPEEGDAVYDALKAGEFPVILIPMIEGKQIKVLEYVSGTYDAPTGIRPSYKKWNRVYKPKEEGMKEAFMQEFTRSGYPKNFTPEIATQAKTKTGVFAETTVTTEEGIAPVTNSELI